MTPICHVAYFAARFCNELDSNKNFICSPLSVETVLALVALGSRNDSRAEIFKALDIPNEDNLRLVFTSLTQNLKKPFIESLTSKLNPFNRDSTLQIATKIYVKCGKSVKPELKKDAEKVFNSSLEQIDFVKSSDAANSINNWVKKRTNNIIKDLVSADMLDGDTGLVLVNAIHFHGFWEIPFDSNDTYDGNFQVNSTKNVNVRMMSLEDKSFNYKHSSELHAKILQMPYVGGEASMVIILPDEIEGDTGSVTGLVKRLAAGFDLMSEIKRLKKTDLQVKIPKFKVETEINLRELLPKMGIQTIFDKNKAEINMLSSSDPLHVSEAIQKALITVDEKGTEAAAANEITLQLLCLRWWMGETFIADHPFLYILLAQEIPIFYGIFQGNETSL